MFLVCLADLGEIRLTGRKYRPRSPFCPGRWAENFFEKLCLVPLLLEFWIFNNRLFFWVFLWPLQPKPLFWRALAWSDLSISGLNISPCPDVVTFIAFFLPPLWKNTFRAPPRIKEWLAKNKHVLVNKYTDVANKSTKKGKCLQMLSEFGGCCRLSCFAKLHNVFFVVFLHFQ